MVIKVIRFAVNGDWDLFVNQLEKSIRNQGILAQDIEKHFQALIVELYLYTVNMSQVLW